MKKFIIFLLFIMNMSLSFSQLNLTVDTTKLNVKVICKPVDSSFDEGTLIKLRVAEKTLNIVFNSEEFARIVLHTNFSTGNYGLSNYEIYDIITSGMNNYKNENKDNVIELKVMEIDKYFENGNFVVTNMKDRTTSTHRCCILKHDVNCYISHLAYEYMHQIGFTDKRKGLFGKKTNRVPYIIGNIVYQLIGKNKNECKVKNSD